MSSVSLEKGTASSVDLDGRSVDVEVQTGYLDMQINGSQAILATVIATPENAQDHRPPMLYRGPFGDSPKSNLDAVVYQAGLHGTTVSGFVLAKAHKTLTNPQEQLVETYNTVNRAVRRELVDTQDQVDQIAISHGAFTLAEDISSYGPSGDVIALMPIGSTAFNVHSEENFRRLDDTEDFKQRVQESFGVEYRESAKWKLLARFGLLNGVTEGSQMLRRGEFKEWWEATQGVGGELFGNLRPVEGSFGKFVVMRAFLAGALVHVAPELRKVRETKLRGNTPNTVNVIAGTSCGVFDYEMIPATLRRGKEIDRLIGLKNVHHPHPACRDGKRVLLAGARAHRNYPQETDAIIT